MSAPHVCRCGSVARTLETREVRAARRRRMCCTSCGERWSTIEARIPEGVQYARSGNAPSFVWVPGSMVDSVRRVLRLLTENLGVAPTEGP